MRASPKKEWEKRIDVDTYKEIIDRINTWRRGEKAGPIWMEITVTQRCNLKCRFCVRNNMQFQPEKELSTERIIELIREAKELGAKRFFVIGGYGEPFAKPGIMKILEEIRRDTNKDDHFETIITNGTLLTKERVYKLVQWDWKQIIISLDSPRAETHDYLRGVPGTFNRVMEALKNFNRAKKKFNTENPEIWISTVLNNRNYKQLLELVVLAAKNRVRKLRVVPLIIKTPEGEKLKLNEEQVRELPKIVEKVERLAKSLGVLTDINDLKQTMLVEKTESMKELILSDIKNKKDFLNVPCYQPWHNIAIRENGFADVCLNLDDRGERVEKKSLKEVWFGKRFEEIRKRFLEHKLFPECDQCCLGLYRKSKEIREFLKMEDLEKRKHFKKVNNKYILDLNDPYFNSIDEIAEMLKHIKMLIRENSKSDLLKDEIVIEETEKNKKVCLAKTVLKKKETKIILKINGEIKERLKGEVLANRELVNFILKNKEIVGILDGEKTFMGPKVVEIHITNKCNNNCIGCWFRSPLFKGVSPLLGSWEDNRAWEKLELPVEKVKKIIDDLAELGTEEIQISGGGEPTIHPNFLEIIKYIRRKGIKLVFTTNFTLWNKKFVEDVVKVKPEQIVVSLWAGTAKTYAKVHPNKTEQTFWKIKENLKYLTRLRDKLYDDKKPGIEICQVILKYNYNELEEMIDFALDVNATAVRFSAFDAVGPTKVLLLNKKETEKVKEQLKRIKKRIEQLNKDKTVLELRGLDVFEASLGSKNVEEGVYTEPLIKNIPCYTGWIRGEVTTSGDVLFCCKAGKVPLGNVFRKNFKDIWTSKEYTKFRVNALNLRKDHPFFKKVGCFKKCDNVIQDILPTLKKLQEMDYRELLILHIGRWLLEEGQL